MGRDRAMVVIGLCVLMILFGGLTKAESNEDRMAELEHLQSRSKDGVIRLTDDRFQRFIDASEPRPYSMVIFFDAKQLRAQTELKLEDFRKEFGLAASAYVKHNRGRSGEGKMIFCDVELREAPGVFNAFSVQSLPHVRLVPPGIEDHTTSVEMNAGNPRTAEGVAAFVSAKTKQDCGPIERPPALSRSQFLGLMVSLLISALILGKKLLAPGSPLRESRVWLAASLAIYFFSVSGGMHNIIRKMPLFMLDRSNPPRPLFFYHGSGMQLGAEGFVVGVLYTIVGLLLGFMTYIVPNIQSKQLQRILMLVIITISFVAVRKVIALDNWKTGYSIHAFWPNRWT